MAELQNVSGIFGGRKSLPAVSHVSINLLYLHSDFEESNSDITKHNSQCKNLINCANKSPVRILLLPKMSILIV